MVNGTLSRGSEGVEAVCWWAKSERCVSGPDPACAAGRADSGEGAQVPGAEHVGMAAARQAYVVLCRDPTLRCAGPSSRRPAYLSEARSVQPGGGAPRRWVQRQGRSRRVT